MENKCVSPLINDTPVSVEVKCGEMQIPDHAIRRFAKFLLPKLQADLEQRKSDESTQG
jgi:hypothetical protein